MKKIRINFDMDGTIANLYGVEDWLYKLTNHIATPYEEATPLLNFSLLARMLNKLQKTGYEIVIISWLAKNSNIQYDNEVTEAKLNWLKKHLPSVHWDEIIIVAHGTPKENYCFGNDILFDDELKNRENWLGQAYDEKEIIKNLKKLLEKA